MDQALLGVLGVSHQFVRLWGPGNRVVVLDEVHAYDTSTTRLTHALVAWLRALGSSVTVMSAALPAATRRELLDRWGARAGEAHATTSAAATTTGAGPPTRCSGTPSPPSSSTARPPWAASACA